MRFTLKRIVSYLTAPLFPFLFVLVLLIAMILFGFPFMIPLFGDIFVAGLFWPVMLVVGLLMAIALVGLVGWPLMSATISAEGTDSWRRSVGRIATSIRGRGTSSGISSSRWSMARSSSSSSALWGR